MNNLNDPTFFIIGEKPTIKHLSYKNRGKPQILNPKTIFLWDELRCIPIFKNGKINDYINMELIMINSHNEIIKKAVSKFDDLREALNDRDGPMALSIRADINQLIAEAYHAAL